MTQPSTISMHEPTPKIRTVTFENPPVNLMVPETVYRLREVVDQLSGDPQVQVVVLTSNTPGFFINHFDLAQAGDLLTQDAEATPAWIDLVERLSTAPFISIAAIRGRTRGAGNELALACDLRYASREQAMFGQPEVGIGILPGGGGTQRLTRLLGRDRALEVVLSADDYDADTAQQYGWVTRAVPDAELDGFVDAMTSRLASFDKGALLAAKAQINQVTLPPQSELLAAYTAFAASLTTPAFAARAQEIGKLAEQKGLDVELHMGDYLGLANQQI
jgi:enoyl-CoA hydratase/carnithine racemase